MNKQLILFFIFITISCSTQLTKEGQNVRLITSNQKEKYCKSIDIVTASNDNGWDAAQDRENAMNEARNKVAKLDGNAMMILSNSNDINGYIPVGNSAVPTSQAVIQVEALKCNFE